MRSGVSRVATPGAGANAESEYFCTLYDCRPQIFRDLARGSPECAGERAVSRRATTYKA